jgi:hypothetical protein
LVMDLEETEARDDRAGKGQHQIDRPIENVKQLPPCVSSEGRHTAGRRTIDHTSRTVT